jgi:hypothetical protein
VLEGVNHVAVRRILAFASGVDPVIAETDTVAPSRPFAWNAGLIDTATETAVGCAVAGDPIARTNVATIPQPVTTLHHPQCDCFIIATSAWLS